MNGKVAMKGRDAIMRKRNYFKENEQGCVEPKRQKASIQSRMFQFNKMKKRGKGKRK